MEQFKYSLRESEDRGYAFYGWLESYHTFSFAEYYDSKFEEFGCLRVINEDRVTPGNGFPTHSHREFNIFSYVVEGELTHNDSMGNKEIIKKGEIQFTCAGTGIRHSEFNLHKTDKCHFIQIWMKPNKSGLKPYYKTTLFPDEKKQGTLCEIVSSENVEGSIPINSNARVFVTLLDKGEKVSHKVQKGRKVYLQLIERTNARVSLNSKVIMKAGDGVFVELKDKEETLTIQGEGDSRNELLVFDVADE
jgi:quercetin 2,3-dioxygenase